MRNRRTTNCSKCRPELDSTHRHVWLAYIDTSGRCIDPGWLIQMTPSVESRLHPSVGVFLFRYRVEARTNRTCRLCHWLSRPADVDFDSSASQSGLVSLLTYPIGVSWWWGIPVSTAAMTVSQPLSDNRPPLRRTPLAAGTNRELTNPTLFAAPPGELPGSFR